MHPPFSLVAPKKTGRARSKRKTLSVPTCRCQVGTNTGVVRISAAEIQKSPTGCAIPLQTERVLPRMMGRGCGFRGGKRMVSAPLSAAAALAHPVSAQRSGTRGARRAGLPMTSPFQHPHHQMRRQTPSRNHVERTRQKAISLHGHRSRQPPFQANKAQGLALRLICAQTFFLFGP